jgi:hypothetical protein
MHFVIARRVCRARGIRSPQDAHDSTSPQLNSKS